MAIEQHAIGKTTKVNHQTWIGFYVHSVRSEQEAQKMYTNKTIYLKNKTREKKGTILQVEGYLSDPSREIFYIALLTDLQEGDLLEVGNGIEIIV